MVVEPDPRPRPGPSGLAATALVAMGLLLVGWFVNRNDLWGRETMLTVEDTGLVYLEGARNLLRLGFGETYGVPMVVGGERTDAERVYYANHPPLLTWGTALVASLGMDVVPAGRVLMLFSWTAAALAVFVLVQRRHGLGFGTIAALAVVASRGNLRGGLFVEVVTGLVVPFTLWAVVAYGSYLERPTRGRAFGVYLLAFAAGFSDWPGLFLPGYLFLHSLFFARRLAILAMPLLPIATLLLWRFLSQLATRQAGHATFQAKSEWSLFAILAGRISEGPVLLSGELASRWPHVQTFTFGPAPWIMAALGLVSLALVRLRGISKPGADGLLLAVFATVTYLVVVFRGAQVHPFWCLSAVPAIVLLATDLVATLWRWPTGHRLRPAIRVGVLVLVAALMGLEVQRGTSAVDAARALALPRDVKLNRLAEALRPFVQPKDQVLVVGDNLRADHLGWHLDRLAFHVHPSPHGIEAARQRFGSRLWVVMESAEALRLPEVAAHLVDFPCEFLATGNEVTFLFDLGSQSPLQGQLSSEQKAAVQAVAAALPAPPPEVRLDGDGRVWLDPDGPKEPCIVRVGLREWESLPLGVETGGSSVPIDRFPRGGAFVSVARGVGGVQRVSAPIRLERPIEAAYVRHGLLLGAAIASSLVILYLLLQWRSRP